MVRRVIVKEVIEENDFRGRKRYHITTQGRDELFATSYRLNAAPMSPDQKLVLACVAPEDEVGVIDGLYTDGILVLGDFVEVAPEVYGRQPICRCSRPLVSDGFDIYCSDKQCPLTMAARMRNLATTDFYNDEQMVFNQATKFMGVQLTFGGPGTKPFLPLIESSTWGYPRESIDSIMLNRLTTRPYISTLMVEPLFTEFAESAIPHDGKGDRHFTGMANFYSDMEQVVCQRRLDSPNQNKMIRGFLKGLSLSRLTEPVIDLLMGYELEFPDGDTFLPYAHALTSYSVLVEQFELYPIEAVALLSEVKDRAYDLFDAFYFYTHENADVVNLFDRLKHTTV